MRARVKGDVERVFPNAETFEDLNADYRYRALIKGFSGKSLSISNF